MPDLVATGDILAGRYRVERILGQGGMGLVVAAEHLELRTLYAIKLLLLEGVDRRKALARFLHEARAASMLRSEHVCRVFDFGKLDDGRVFMVMEHLSGSDLAQVLSQYGPLPLPEAARYVLHACEALAEAHGCGIVHRDLKPANLFLTRANDGSPCVKVLDFGIAKQLSPNTTSQPTAAEAILGSPRYMSPEQIRAAPHLDARSDIWSMGVTLYELITGVCPFDGDGIHVLLAGILQDSPVLPSQVVPGLPPALDVVLLRCLAKEPVERYPDIAALARALLPFAPADAAPLVERAGRVLASSGGRRAVVAPEGDFDFGGVNTTTLERPLQPVTQEDPFSSDAPASASSRREFITQEAPSLQVQGHDPSSSPTSEHVVPDLDPGVFVAGAQEDNDPPRDIAPPPPQSARALEPPTFAPSAPPPEAATARATPAPSRRRTPHLRAAAAGLAVLLPCAMAADWLFSSAPPPGPAPERTAQAALARRVSTLPITPFPQHAVGIVVVAPPESSGAALPLCKKLQSTGPRPLSCVARTAPDGRAIVAEAGQAGASLVVALSPEETASVTPVDHPDLDGLLRGMPPIETSRDDFVPSVAALGVLAAHGVPELSPDECPRLDRGPLHRLSLLVSLLVPSCLPDKLDPRRLAAVCGTPEAAADISCALARVLYLERRPDAPELTRRLEELLGRAPEPVQRVARLKLARSHCEAGDIERASEELRRLSARSAGCSRLLLAPVAACVVSSASSSGEGAQAATVDQAIRDLESLAPDAEGCPRLTRARAVGERAFWRGRGGRWREAESDYRSAYALYPDPQYALGQAEALLHQKQPADAFKVLQATQGDGSGDPADALVRGLLRWIAAREQGASAAQEAEALVEQYAAFPAGAPGLDEPDPDLRGLACRKEAPCPVDVLTGPKTEASVERLRRSLSGDR
jgi:eukaryotic-like serine/threonine-protein kinase